jgi:hypothetical protein
MASTTLPVAIALTIPQTRRPHSTNHQDRRKRVQLDRAQLRW